LPEGGTNYFGVKGCSEILDGIQLDSFDILCVACGTGGTLAGILESLNGKNFCIGFPVLKNGSFLRKNIDQLNLEYSGNRYQNYILNTRYHWGGYARFNQALVQFINDFRHQYGIPLDPVYTGKMMYGVFDLIHSGAFRAGTRILIIHTGGLQGISGFNERHGNLIGLS
jgi:1-aminocyclopropane-1-carboxylate deaminase/D-cysteine desulfhydrase-like pyridoxal-dependent ACC family enzyme